MGVRSVVRSISLIAASTVLVTATTAGGPVAFAVDPDPGVADVLHFLGADGGPGTLAAWTSTLGGIGKLAEPLPLVDASPGALIGADDLVAKAIADEFGTATTWGGLVLDRAITFPPGDGRSGHITTSTPDEGDGKRLNVDVAVTKHVTGQSLSLSSASPKVELSIKDGITVDVTATLSLSVVWTGETDDRVYLVAGPSTPRLDVDASASIDPTTAKAAIGILGVQLDGSTLDVKAHLVGRVDDPDNDGRLAFDETGTGDGELAADGSLDGLFSVGLDPDGSSTDPGSRGSVAASFDLGAAAGGIAGLTLPSTIAATVGVTWADIGTDAPVVTAPDLANTVGKFQNMSLRDLADGLGQVVTSLTAIQKAKYDADGSGAGTDLIGDLDLPFMKGTVSDAVHANAALVSFLEEWVVQSPDPDAALPPDFDPATVGQPKFTSLQDLLTQLENHAGISLGALSWDPASSKLAFALTLSQAAPPSPVALDELSVKASGASATYSPDGLSLGTSPWTADQWVGMRIVAGNSAGEIASNTPSSLTLDGDWIGGQPADDEPFVIVGPQPHIGAVTFANTLEDAGGHGLVNANADQTFAKVSPSYTTTLTLVLDLQDPKTGNACIGFMGSTEACPFTRTDGPFSTQVDALPLNSDRLMIRTGSPLVVADFPIETQVDLTANAGFFKVRVQGSLEVCSSSKSTTCTGTATGHMLSIGLKELGDAQHDLRFSELFAMLVKPDGQPSQASDLLDGALHVRAYGSMSVSVPDASDFLPGGATADFTASWNDLTKLTGADGPQLDTSDLAEVFKLDFDAADPKALFAIVIKTLQTLSAQLAEASPGGVYGKDIPGMGRSLRDLMRSDESNQGSQVTYGNATLTDSSKEFGPEHVGRAVVVGTQVALVQSVQAGSSNHTLVLTDAWAQKPADGTAYSFRSPLDDAVDLLLASPPDNLQDLVAILDDRLGSDALAFRYLDTGGTPSLVLDLDWDRSYRTSAPIRLDLGSVAGSDRTFAGAQASGNADVAVDGTVKVGLVVPLAPGDGPSDATSLKVLEDSAIGIRADAAFAGTVQGVIGPLSLALGKPGGPAADQAKAAANISLDLAKPGAGTDTPVSFGTFVSGLSATFNAHNSPVECGEGLSTPLMVCGRLPLFVNAAGSADTWTPAGTIALRLPDTSAPADLTDLSGNLPTPDDGLARLEIPPDLGTRLLDAVLDFNNLGTGLDGYLVQIEKAFRLAAFNGKLPLIGDDLQQGADFIGGLRTTLQNSIWSQLPGGGRPLDAKEVTDFIDANLASALDAAGMSAVGLNVGFVCTATLEQANAPAVSTTTATPTTTWQYKIVAHQGTDSSGTVGDTTPSNAGSTGPNAGPDTLDTDNYNTVSWPAVDGATGYKILRKKQGESDFSFLTLVTTTTYTDKGQDTPTAYTPVTLAPDRVPCPPEAIDGVTLEFTVRQGKVSPGQGCQADADPSIKPCLEADVPLDIGIPGLALKAGPSDDPASDGISTKLGFALHFKIGLSKEKGFFVNTHDGWGSDDKAYPELQVGLGFDLPGDMLAELAFLKIHVSKHEGATGKLFAGAFQIDLRSSAGEASCWTGTGAACTADETKVLTFADLGDTDVGDLFGISLKGGFDLDWDIVADADAALPGVRTNFKLTWSFDNNAPSAFGTPYIAFKDVGINAGSFFQGLLGPIVKEVKRVTGPIQPVVDTLYAPIPVLSDLSKLAGGEDVTLVTLAKTFNTLAGGPSLDFVDTVKAVIDFINHLPTCGSGEACFIPIGSFEVLGAKALETSATPSAGTGLIDKVNNYHAATAEQMKSKMNAANDNPDASGKPVFTTSGGSGTGDAEKSGFSFPILDNPGSAFSLLMGDDITLVEFDSGPLTLGFSWRQSFGPVYAPPPVMVTLSGSASVTLRFMAGLDTAGIRHAVEAAQEGSAVDPVKLLDGLFFKTVDKDGKPVPVVRLDGEIAAGAAVSALVITVGIEGGLHLTIGFYWNDPNDDGKFRVSEFLQAAIVNPLCLFTTSGRLSLFLRVYITLGFSPFSVSFDFTLADVTLLDFTAQPDCSPPPPKLGGTVGDTLVVYAGDFGMNANRGAPWGNNATDYDEDVVKITALHFLQRSGDPQGVNGDFDGFAVDMLGEHREYPDPALTRVVVDGSDYDKPMIITFVGDGKKEGESALPAGTGADLAVFDKDAVVFGGSGDDTIQTGTGKSYVDGGAGNDTIVTADTNAAGSLAWVAGGPDDDKISTGNGDDHVAGDGSLGTATRPVQVRHNDVDGGGTADLASVVDWEHLADPTGPGTDTGSGDDTIGVGLGANRVRGNGGDDKIGVATDAPDGSDTAGDNTIIGGSGGDRITGGSGNDTIFTAGEQTFGVDGSGPADTSGKSNVVDTGSGNDTVWGSTVEDHVSSYSKKFQHAKIVGGGGDDALMGGYGTDEIYGGPDDDYVIAEPAKVGAQGTTDTIEGTSFGKSRPVEKLPLPAGTTPSTKTLVGGLGNDHVLGGDGTALIFGDKLRDATVAPAADETCHPGSPVTSDPVPEGTNGAGGDGNDLILGGAGVDTVSAGGGADRVLGYGADDLLCGQEGTDVLYGGDGADHLWGGSGHDRGYGDGGNDHVFGNGGPDTLYGQDGVDVVEGNDGTDWASGGGGDDFVYGGTRAPGRDDKDPAGPGVHGDDLYGDSGNDRLIGDNGTSGSLAVPVDLDGATSDAGRGDRIHGGDGEDTAYGGIGDDVVNGNAGDDHLEGNNGTDTVHGNAGEDRIVGGSFEQASAGVGRPDSGDFLYGDAGPDLLTGDNAVVTVVTAEDEATAVTLRRGFALRYQVTLLDLGDSAMVGTSGHDLMIGGDGQDVLYGQGGNDRVKAGAGDDYAEGGPGIDWLEGNLGDDDLVGGSSTPVTGSGDSATGQPDAADAIFGGPGDDVAVGDNGQALRPGTGTTPTRATVRLGSTPGQAMTPRLVQMWDRSVGSGYLTAPSATRFGGDQISGGSGVDTLWGQDGGDAISGGAGADYVEGNGGADVIRGDSALADGSTRGLSRPTMANGDWPGTGTDAYARDGATTPEGQDDLIGGTATPGFRDGGDDIEGNGDDDVILGDNGSLVRTLQGGAGSWSERVYTDRYPDGAVPADATVARSHDPALAGPSTRFCTTEQDTCEPVSAFGSDHLYGDSGDDGIWGQDGNDVLYGGEGNDDMYGELGDDTMYGEAGEDAMLGDRGGVVNQLLSADDSPAVLTFSLTQPPREDYTGFPRGHYDRRVDLLHDVDADQWVGAATGPAMPHAGLLEGGRDRIRGGPDEDNIHAGFGDDLANGDSGGDQVFGDDGEDVLWGGRGCDPVLDASEPDCLTGGVFDATARGADDRMIDHVFGGVGEPDPAEQDVLGSDILDFNPRGSYDPGTGCTTDDWPATVGGTTIDPCEWFVMTDKHDTDPSNNNHHQGTDWIYGGWDRDVMQGDVTTNGPNSGDRLIDWNGAYNLYTHCNAAYGGFNDIRLLAPDLYDFLTGLAWGSGAGRSASDVTTPGTSAYRELAFTYTEDQKEHGAGKAYPQSPGHFNEAACDD